MLLYVVSILLIVTAIFFFVEYWDYKDRELDSAQLMEVGPAFINGVSPEKIKTIDENRKFKFYEVVTDQISGLTPSIVIDKFSRVSAPQSGEGPRNSWIIEEITDPNDTYYRTFLLDMSSSEIGPMFLTDNYFPDTVSEMGRIDGLRRLYYSPINEYSDVVIVASLDIRFLPTNNWIGNVWHDIWMTMPAVVFLSILLGWIVSKWTVAPIIRIAQVANRLGVGDLKERAEIRSKDEIGSLALSLNRMADKIQSTIDSQKRFISDAAHELKTPLASMKTSVTGALDNKKNHDEYQELLSFLSGRLEVQENLINNLLFLARADEGRLQNNFQDIEILDIIHEAEDAFRYVCEEKGILFEIKACPNALIQGDKQMLLHLFSNILDNAYKNTPPGGSVCIEVERSDGQVIVCIHDTGVGIPSESVPLVFDRFYKTRYSSASGFGLGLAICKSIIDCHEGTINVDSKEGVGTTFSIILQVHQ